MGNALSGMGIVEAIPWLAMIEAVDGMAETIRRKGLPPAVPPDMK